MKPILSLSGIEMDVSDPDRILIAIMDTRIRDHVTNMDGQEVIGPSTAVAVLESLKEHGFHIVRN
jgi:hypothetical protein